MGQRVFDAVNASQRFISLASTRELTRPRNLVCVTKIPEQSVNGTPIRVSKSLSNYFDYIALCLTVTQTLHLQSYNPLDSCFDRTRKQHARIRRKVSVKSGVCASPILSI